jgi:hypothetical protein
MLSQLNYSNAGITPASGVFSCCRVFFVAVSQPCCWSSQCTCCFCCTCLLLASLVSHQLLDCLLLPMSLLLQTYLLALASLLSLTLLMYDLIPTLLLLASLLFQLCLCCCLCPCYFNCFSDVACVPAVSGAPPPPPLQCCCDPCLVDISSVPCVLGVLGIPCLRWCPLLLLVFLNSESPKPNWTERRIFLLQNGT